MAHLFAQARELPDDRRQAFIAEECGDDAELKQDLEAMLAHAAHGASVFSESEVFFGTPLLANSDGRVNTGGDAAGGASQGKRIGRYQIIDKIGEGGMGTVYEARQDHPRRTVALKVLRTGLATTEMLKRFEYEVQVLGRLQHPNIAQIIEAGVVEDSGERLPYFAMELIHGERLDSYLERADLSVAQRLELFARICDAVQHAHQKGVIHRDLKPSNILVMAPEDASSVSRSDPTATMRVGQPKVLDFGLAKLTESDVAGVTMVTELGRIQGTLPFMSPEQARGRPDEVDSRSDVYALGVVLYKMLTGQQPYDVERDALPEAVRVICEQPPRPPSAIDRSLRGDVETIVRKALEKEPDRRYHSAAALAEDVRRCLADQPIQARRPSASYQLRKLVARHKVPASFAAAFVLVLIAFGVWMSVLYTRAAANLTRARDAERTARFEADTAEETATFMVDMFTQVDPASAQGHELTARELLDRGAESIRNRLKRRPKVRARILAGLGATYQTLGYFKEAAALLEEALSIEGSLDRKDRQHLCRTVGALAMTLEDLGELDSAETMYRRELKMATQLFGQDGMDVANAKNNYGSLLLQRGRYDDAQKMFEQSLATRKELFGERSGPAADTLHNLALTFRDRGWYDRAESMFREVLAIQLEVLGENHPDRAVTLYNLAQTVSAMGRHDECEKYLLEGLALAEKTLEPRHPIIANLNSTLGVTYLHQGRYDEAIDRINFALEHRIKYLGPKHSSVGYSQYHLGTLYYRMGELDKAERYLREAVATLKAAFGPKHADLAEPLNNLGALLQTRGKLDDAEKCLRESLEINRATLDESHPSIATNLDNLGLVMLDRGDSDEANRLLRKALDMRRTVFGEAHEDVAQSLTNVGRLERKQGKLQESKQTLSDAVTILKQVVGEAHPLFGPPNLSLAETLLELSLPEEAETHARLALKICRASSSLQSWECAQAESVLGACLAAQSRFAEAEPMLVSSHEHLDAQLGPDHHVTREAQQRIDALRTQMTSDQGTVSKSGEAP